MNANSRVKEDGAYKFYEQESCRRGMNYHAQFKVDRLQIMLVAKKYIYVSQLFISRMPKMRAIPQLVSAPLNPIPIAEHFRRSHPPCEHSRGQHIQVRKITQSKTKTLLNQLNVHAT